MRRPPRCAITVTELRHAAWHFVALYRPDGSFVEESNGWIATYNPTASWALAT